MEVLKDMSVKSVILLAGSDSIGWFYSIPSNEETREPIFGQFGPL